VDWGPCHGLPATSTSSHQLPEWHSPAPPRNRAPRCRPALDCSSPSRSAAVLQKARPPRPRALPANSCHFSVQDNGPANCSPKPFRDFLDPALTRILPQAQEGRMSLGLQHLTPFLIQRFPSSLAELTSILSEGGWLHTGRLVPRRLVTCSKCRRSEQVEPA